jgi:RNA polymerase sigma-70 factor, ECF subfamily
MPSDPLVDEIVEFKPRLLAFARSLGTSEDEAEDLVQETYVRAIGARQRFTPGSNLKAWLFTILRNLHLNRVRDAGARSVAGAFDEVLEEEAWVVDRGPVSSVERDVLARAELDLVVRAFRSLPPAFAVPLHLVAVEDLSYAQVAILLEIPVGTVMSRVYRARRQLLHILGGSG